MAHISNGLLGVVVVVAGFVDGVFKLGGEGLELGLSLAALVAQDVVLCRYFGQAVVGILEVSLCQFAGALCCLEGRADLLEFLDEHHAAALGDLELVAHVLAGTGLFVNGGLEFLNLHLELLDGLDGLGAVPVGMVELDFQVVDLALELLL